MTDETSLYIWGCVFVCVALLIYELMGNDE
jgi:hypothetical protein